MCVKPLPVSGVRRGFGLGWDISALRAARPVLLSEYSAEIFLGCLD